MAEQPTTSALDRVRARLLYLYLRSAAEKHGTATVQPARLISLLELEGAAELALFLSSISERCRSAGLSIQPSQHAINVTIGADPKSDPGVIGRVFAHWRRVVNRPAAKLTQERRAKIVARLREGYTEADLVAAIDGCAASPFHRGENESGSRYDDLTLIFRNGSKLESFLGRAASGTAATRPTADDLHSRAFKGQR